jgi:micrococcal nuclease
MEKPKYEYSAKLDRVVDGDTIDAWIDLGFGIWHHARIRFYGVDTWESRTRDLEEKKKGLAAKQFVKDRIGKKNSYFTLVTHKEKGKYGRVLGEIVLNNMKAGCSTLNEELVFHGHACRYYGGNKQVARLDEKNKKAA